MSRLDPIKESLYLDEFQFAHCKKVLANQRNIIFNVTTDDMFPYLKFTDEIEIAPLNTSPSLFDIITFYREGKVEYGIYLGQEGDSWPLYKSKEQKILHIKKSHLLGRAINKRLSLLDRLLLYFKKPLRSG